MKKKGKKDKRGQFFPMRARYAKPKINLPWPNLVPSVTVNKFPTKTTTQYLDHVSFHNTQYTLRRNILEYGANLRLNVLIHAFFFIRLYFGRTHFKNKWFYT